MRYDPRDRNCNHHPADIIPAVVRSFEALIEEDKDIKDIKVKSLILD
jgi:hypothetical protein